VARDYKVGDWVWFSTNGSVVGEAMFVGRLRSDPSVLMLFKHSFFEIDAEDCGPAQGGEPALGAAHRREYLKQHPGSLLPSQ
jgi:hypothetical protein